MTRPKKLKCDIKILHYLYTIKPHPQHSVLLRVNGVYPHLSRGAQKWFRISIPAFTSPHTYEAGPFRNSFGHESEKFVNVPIRRLSELRSIVTSTHGKLEIIIHNTDWFWEELFHQPLPGFRQLGQVRWKYEYRIVGVQMFFSVLYDKNCSFPYTRTEVLPRYLSIVATVGVD